MVVSFPKLDEALRLKHLTPPTDKVQMVLDTDTYNEIDDQFAVVQALLSPDQLAVKAIYAAPFYCGPQPDIDRSEDLEPRPSAALYAGGADRAARCDF